MTDRCAPMRGPGRGYTPIRPPEPAAPVASGGKSVGPDVPADVGTRPAIRIALQTPDVDRSARTDRLASAARNVLKRSSDGYSDLFIRNLVAVERPAWDALRAAVADEYEPPAIRDLAADDVDPDTRLELEGAASRIRRTIDPSPREALAIARVLSERVAALEGAVFAGRAANPELEARVRGVCAHLDGWLRERRAPFDADELRAELGNLYLALCHALDETSAP